MPCKATTPEMRDFRAIGEVQSGTHWFEDLKETCVREWRAHEGYTRVAFVQSGRAWTEFEVLRELMKVRMPKEVRLSEHSPTWRKDGKEVMEYQFMVNYPMEDILLSTSTVHVDPQLTNCLFVAINPSMIELRASRITNLPHPSTYISMGILEGDVRLEVRHSSPPTE